MRRKGQPKVKNRKSSQTDRLIMEMIENRKKDKEARKARDETSKLFSYFGMRKIPETMEFPKPPTPPALDMPKPIQPVRRRSNK
jgi:hypothetical protein